MPGIAMKQYWMTKKWSTKIKETIIAAAKHVGKLFRKRKVKIYREMKVQGTLFESINMKLGLKGSLYQKIESSINLKGILFRKLNENIQIEGKVKNWKIIMMEIMGE